MESQVMLKTTQKLMHIFRFLPLMLGALCAPAWGDVGAAKYQYEKGHFDVALQQAKTLADAGDSDAQAFMAVLYTEGKAVPQDYAQAAEWYWKAANAGNTGAQLALSAIYADGRGVPQDDNLANYWKWQAGLARTSAAKDRLETELATQAQLVTGTLKFIPPTININDCKAPVYKHSGYGYHLSGEIQMLFMVQPNGKILETALLEKGNWPTLARDYLESYTKTCTFKPATNRGDPVMGVYKLKVSWNVEP
jgi:Sel1 repeat